MSKDDSTGKIQWDRLLKKLSPYTVQKGLRYLKHYGLKEFWIRLHERFEPEEVPYGPWYEAYIPDKAELEKQKAADDVKQQIVAVSAMIASKLIAKSIDESESNAIIEQTLNEMGENTWRNK